MSSHHYPIDLGDDDTEMMPMNAKSEKQELEFKDFSTRETTAVTFEDNEMLIPRASSKPSVSVPQVTEPPLGSSSGGLASLFCSCCTIEYYQPWFDVDTTTLSKRLLRSFMPWKQFFLEDDMKPDLYGPFWIATTLIILISFAGNAGTYFKASSSSKWFFDATKTSSSASLYYSLISIFPLMIYFLLSYLGNPLTWGAITCIFGYGMSSYLMVSLLCLIPSDIFQWFAISLAFAVSSWFHLTNFKAMLDIDGVNKDKKSLNYVLISLVVIQFGVAVACKLYFFQYAI